VRGAAELLAEIAYSSVAIDLHLKKDDYQKAGVREYLVVCVREPEYANIWWCVSESRSFTGLTSNPVE
jgi:hypothetical protein